MVSLITRHVHGVYSMIEEIDHLLLGRVYSRNVWYLMLSGSGWQDLSLTVQEATVTWWL
jgi:hypothetical protein